MVKEDALELEAKNDYIDTFEIWDRVEIKFKNVTEGFALQSFEQHGLNYTVGIQESDGLTTGSMDNLY